LIDASQEISIELHIEQFLKNRIKKIKTLRFKDLEINPILIATIKNQMGLKTQHDLADWLVRQRIERGTVTSFGLILQEIAKEFSNEESLPGFTMKIKKDGKNYNLLITSGPNPYARPQAVAIVEKFLRSKKIESGSIPILCMCYGNEKAISSIVKNDMKEVRHLIGRDFWEFISDDRNCRDKILKISKEAGERFQKKNELSLKKAIEKKVNNIEQELKEWYGTELETFWKNVLYDAYI